MNIGIMGGTFDPPHMGHVLPVQTAAEEFALDQVWFIPNSIPPHKVRPNLTDSYHRAAMVALAVSKYPNFLLNTHELRREVPAYTYDTILELKETAPAGTRFHFILGSDSFLEIESWYRYAELIMLCEFIIIDRGDREEELSRNLDHLETTLQKSLKRTFHFCRAEHIPVSSTSVREALFAGKSIAGMVPDEVEAYILKHNLYPRRKKSFD